jgi:2-keto-4-pentenoate hydratase/2-oxohepta-3-ene-1,7-dioic acid hydratase in catechol pathway
LEGGWRISGGSGFWKLGREIVGPDGELMYPERCNRLDYEGEIAIVLGKRGADLKASQLKDYVCTAAAPSKTPPKPYALW